MASGCYPESTVDTMDSTTSTFFVNGLRHRLSTDASVAAALTSLHVGDRLQLVEEPDNPADARALLVAEGSGVALAWVPKVLLDYVHDVRRAGDAIITVTSMNGPDVPTGYRLLVTLEGRVAVGYEPFGGAAWETAPPGR